MRIIVDSAPYERALIMPFLLLIEWQLLAATDGQLLFRLGADGHRAARMHCCFVDLW